jgi:uncharacterized protein YbjT (DUF2867 family)
MIVVTTPTGNIGRQLLKLLLDSGEAVRVIAREPTRLAAEVRGRVEVVEGSHGDLATVNRAFQGARALLWIPPPSPRSASVEAAYLDFTRPACEALQRSGIERVVSVSALGRGSPLARNAGLVTASLAMDDLLAATLVSFRALTAPSFMDNMLRQAATLRERGVFFSPLAGDRKHPTCATRDIAAVAARLLADPSWRGQDSIPILGPEDLSCNDMAGIMSEVLGRPIRFEQVSLQAFKAGLVARGTSEPMAQATADMMAAKDAGLDHAVARTADNASPTSFRSWCEQVLKPAVGG